MNWTFLTCYLWSLTLTLPWFLPHEDQNHVETVSFISGCSRRKIDKNFLVKSVRVCQTLRNSWFSQLESTLPRRSPDKWSPNDQTTYSPPFHFSPWQDDHRNRFFRPGGGTLRLTEALWELSGLLVFTSLWPWMVGASVRTVTSSHPLAAAHFGLLMLEASTTTLIFLFVKLVALRSAVCDGWENGGCMCSEPGLARSRLSGSTADREDGFMEEWVVCVPSDICSPQKRILRGNPGSGSHSCFFLQILGPLRTGFDFYAIKQILRNNYYIELILSNTFWKFVSVLQSFRKQLKEPPWEYVKFSELPPRFA